MGTDRSGGKLCPHSPGRKNSSPRTFKLCRLFGVKISAYTWVKGSLYTKFVWKNQPAPSRPRIFTRVLFCLRVLVWTVRTSDAPEEPARLFSPGVTPLLLVFKKKGWSSFLGCLGWAVAEVKQSRRPHTEHAVKLHPSSRLFGVRGGKEVRSFQHCSSSYLLWLQSAIMWTHVGPFRNCHMEAAVRHTEQVREVWRNHETAGSSFKIQVC